MEKTERDTSGLSSCSPIININIDYWVRRGCDRNALINSLGVHADKLDDPELRIPVDYVNALYATAADELNDKTLGLITGCHLPPTVFGPMGHLIIASNTVQQIFDAICRFCFLTSDFIEVNLVKADPIAKIVYSPVCDVNYHILDSAIACFATNAQHIVREFQIDVNLGHAPFKSIDTYKEIMGVNNIRFEAGEYSAEFPIGALDHVIGFSNTDDYDRQSKQASMALKKLNLEYSCSKRVRSLLTNLFHHGEPEISEVAEQLGVSTRKLQRDLQDEGTSFRALLDETRKELVLNEMQTGQHIYEIAFRAGFKETSSFYKAFKRWTGTTPKEYMLKQQ